MDDIRAKTVQEIDEEIARLEERLVSLRTERNQLAPISRLPFELFGRIFLLADRELRGNKPLPWPLLFSSVSRDWREIALNLPDLWSSIDNSITVEGVYGYLNRSRDMSLHISYGDTSSILPAIGQNIQRLQFLSIGCRSADNLSLSDAPWKAPAPRLENMRVRGLGIPRTIFTGRAPLLRELMLSDCKFDWKNIPVFPALTDLSLIRPQPLIAVDDLLGRLSKHTQLRNLNVEGALTGPRSTTLLPRCLLPNLVIIYANAENCVNVAKMLQSLILPKISDLYLFLNQTHFNDQATVITACQSCFPISTAPIRSLILKVRKHFSSYVISCDDISAVFKFSWSSRDEPLMSDVHSMCTQFNLERVKEVRLDILDAIIDHPNSDFWNIFSSSQKLVVRDGGLQLLSIYLDNKCGQPRNQIGASQLENAIPFPHLQKLVIRRPSQDERVSSSYLRSVLRFLELRPLTGRRRLESLVLCSIFQPSDELNRSLRGAVRQYQMLREDARDKLDSIASI